MVQALSRGERMDQTLQKCTELGAAAFQPLVSERSELRLAGEKLARRIEHWQGVVISACEQSGRARVPEVRRVIDLVLQTVGEARTEPLSGEAFQRIVTISRKMSALFQYLEAIAGCAERHVPLG